MRKLILDADPDAVEEWKWMGTPVWEHDGIICTGESYKDKVKLTFAKGASLKDPAGLFNSSLEGNTRRAIDIHEGEEVDATAFKALVKAAVAHNSTKPTKSAKPAKLGVVLLSGGNPQIAKADGDTPVQSYIAAMPGGKRGVGKQLGCRRERLVPLLPRPDALRQGDVLPWHVAEASSARWHRAQRRVAVERYL